MTNMEKMAKNQKQGIETGYETGLGFFKGMLNALLIEALFIGLLLAIGYLISLV